MIEKTYNLDIDFLKGKAKELRKMVLIMTTKAGIGHVTSSFSCMELLTALYYGNLIKVNPKQPDWKERDFFLFSKGHGNPALYCILADLGFFQKDMLNHFCEKDAGLGVLLRGSIPGVEASFGSVGCGLGLAAGIAEGLSTDGKDNKVICMIGDAECREGAIWEAALYCGYRHLKNLTVIVDANGLGATHFVENEAGIEPLTDKWLACDFYTKRVNGHSFEEIFAAFNEYERSESDKPFALIADTIKGKGVSFIENEPFMHGLAVNTEKIQEALGEVERGLIL